MPFPEERRPGAGRAWIQLNMDHLRHNVSVLRNRLPPGCRLMPVVKADAYGHGAVLIAGELNRLGIHAFCVATAGEGAELREYGIQGDILILVVKSNFGVWSARKSPLISCCMSVSWV